MNQLYKTKWIVVLLLVAVGVIGLASAESTARVGRIPREAFESSGIRMDLVPEYIVAHGRDGAVAGYIAKNALFDERGHRRSGRLEVVDETLKVVVGHMVPDRGFIPAGTRDEDVKTFQETGPTELPEELQK